MNTNEIKQAIAEIKAEIKHAEAKLMNFNRKQLADIAKEAGCYSGNSRAVKSVLVKVIADHLTAVVEAEQPATPAVDVQDVVDLKQELRKLKVKDLKKRIAGHGLSLLADVKGFKKAELVEYIVTLETTQEAAPVQEVPAAVVEVVEEQPAAAQEAQDAFDFEETIMVTVGEQITPETPAELPTELEAVYTQTTAEEQAAFDNLLATAANKKQVCAVKTATQDKATIKQGKKRAGCSRLDAVLLWAIEGGKSEGVRVENMVEAWAALSGIDNAPYITRRVTIHLKDMRSGSLGRSCLKGWKVKWDQEALAQGIYKIKENAPAYDNEVKRIKSKLPKELVARIELAYTNPQEAAEQAAQERQEA